MTPEELERLAYKAGAETGAVFNVDRAWLARFAALVRAHALEQAAQLVQANALACADGSMLQVYLASNAAAIRALGSSNV